MVHGLPKLKFSLQHTFYKLTYLFLTIIANFGQGSQENKQIAD